jgi:hypothetical protein
MLLYFDSHGDKWRLFLLCTTDLHVEGANDLHVQALDGLHSQAVDTCKFKPWTTLHRDGAQHAASLCRNASMHDVSNQGKRSLWSCKIIACMKSVSGSTARGGNDWSTSVCQDISLH